MRENKRWARSIFFILAAQSFGGLLSNRALADYPQYWIGGTSNWNNPNNWNPAAVPTGNSALVTSTAGISQAVTYDYTGSPDFNALNINLSGFTTGSPTETLSMAAGTIAAGEENIGGYPTSGTLPNIVYNGAHGNGTFIQSGGTNTFDVNNLYLGYATTDQGIYNLSGTGKLTSSYSEYIGNGGTGTFNQSGGTNNLTAAEHESSSNLYVGALAGSTGNYNLNSGTLLIGPATGFGPLNAGEVIGYNGTGTLTQIGGGNTINTQSFNSFILGYAAKSNGTYTFSGGTLKMAEANEIVGDSGTGAFNQSGSTTNSPTLGELILGNNNGSSGTYNLSGSATLSMNNSELIGNSGAGAFVQNGGTNTIASEYGLSIGSASYGDGGTYTLNSGTLNTSSEGVGDDTTGTFTQTGGTNTTTSLSMGGSNVLNAGPGIYNLSGTGALSVADDEIIGANDGTAKFIQTGGTNSLTGTNSNLGVEIASSTNSTGSYALSSGTATFGGNLYVGGSNTAAGGKGTLTVSGTGVLNVGGIIKIYNTTGTSVTLSGGTINTGGISVLATTSNFTWTSGTLHITDDVTFDQGNYIFGSSLSLNSSQTLIVDGEELLGISKPFALTVGPGSTDTTGFIYADLGSCTQTGGTISATQFEGNFTQSGGIATFKDFVVKGILNLTGGQTILLPHSPASQITGLSMSNNGIFDLANNNLTIKYTGASPATTIAGYLASGYAKGLWNGPGIDSSIAAANVKQSTSLGYSDSGTQILIKYTWLGDLNLDGVVNVADLAMISPTGTTWSTGDFNYDGKVNADDYALFMLGAAESNGENISMTVPEPADSLLLLPAIFLLRRKR